MKLLIIYYSLGGNTQIVAEKIQSLTGGQIQRIETSVPYTGGYDHTVEQGHREVERGYLPELKPLSVNLSDFDTLALGTPVWWYTCAPAMKSFIVHNNLAGKTIYPFITNGGWIGHTEKDLAADCAGAIVKPAVNLVFHGHNQAGSADILENWVRTIC